MKTTTLTLLFTLGTTFITVSHAQTINTFAGNGVQGYSGDGGQATAAEIDYSWQLREDGSGNLYIADFENNSVRMVNTSGVISTVAGNGTGAFYGDGGPATAAELDAPGGVAFDASGNMYIADWSNNRVRIINTSGIINTFAGNGVQSYSGDGGQATAAELYDPVDVAVDGSGNVYICDEENNRIRMVNTAGTISTYAGNGATGYSGDGGAATASELDTPISMALDGAGNLYISDYSNSSIRMVNTSGIISTVAGNGVDNYSGDGGPATAAEISLPDGVFPDASGNFYISDGGNSRIRFVTASGTITTVTGNDTVAYSGDGGPASAAEINSPAGIALDLSGNVLFVDRVNNRIREISPGLTGVKNLSITSSPVSVYPVPSTGSFTLTGLMPDETVEIYNYLGEKITQRSQPVTNGLQMHFDLSDNASGIYYYRVINENGKLLGDGKIIIEK